MNDIQDVFKAEKNPIAIFKQWFQAAINTNMKFPESFILSTSSTSGIPSARVLLFKGLRPAAGAGVGEKGEEEFSFYTNYDSRKGQELLLNPFAAMTFYWSSLDRQVRIEGSVHKMSREESIGYFHSRPRESQIGAHASQQGQVIQSRQEILARYQELEKKFLNAPIPCPDYWGGFLLRPQMMEFWINSDWRLHDRYQYQRTSGGQTWQMLQLSP